MAILNGRIVCHLEDPPGTGLAACSGEEIETYPECIEKDRGFVFCPACSLIYRRG